jgi:hypothetical protein
MGVAHYLQVIDAKRRRLSWCADLEGRTMNTVAELAERYVAVWNEADPETRRRRIAELWTREGGTSHRLIDAFGYEALEGRVTRSYDKWIAEKGYRFRALGKAVGHHGTVKFVWEMVPADGGGAISVGIDLLVLGPDGRIQIAYQFIEPGPPASTEHQAVVERYVDFWKRPSAEKGAALWTEDCAHIGESREHRGRAAIETAAAETPRDHVAKGVDGHHDVVRFTWDVRPRDGGTITASGVDFLILDGDGRIRRDYRFND